MKRSVYFRLVITVISIFFVSNLVAALVIIFVIRPETPMSPLHDSPFGMRIVIFISAIFSLLLGSVITLVAIRRTVRPIREMSGAARKIAQGDFDIRVDSSRKDEIGELARNFNAMAEELQKIEVMRSDFVSSVSHEFRTPLASIEGYARLLKDESLSAAQSGYADVIISEAGRLSRMCGNILLLGRLEAGNYDHSKKSYSLDEQVRKAVLLLQNEWTEKGIDFDIELHRVGITAGEDLLMQVWINLIGNAVKFSPSGGKVGISLAAQGGRAVFKAVNRGEPLARGEIRHIFDKFYQGDKSRSGEGNGLGLSIAKRIIEIHGGSIEAESGGEGTVFTVELPLKQGEEE